MNEANPIASIKINLYEAKGLSMKAIEKGSARNETAITWCCEEGDRASSMVVGNGAPPRRDGEGCSENTEEMKMLYTHKNEKHSHICILVTIV